MNKRENRRILLIDDMPSIHEAFRKILVPRASASDLGEVEAALFGDAEEVPVVGFELDSAYQGREGLDKVEESLQTYRPYAMAFVDMRMPPGWDGLETIERLWQKDPRLQIVICTAHSDHSWKEVLTRLHAGDRMLILKKPFDDIEIWQLACTLTAKWEMTQSAALQMSSLEGAVQEGTRETRRVNETLRSGSVERKHLESQLLQSEKLAAIGQLAAGVAHDIHNPINSLLSNLSTLEIVVLKLFERLADYEDVERTSAVPNLAARLKNLRERTRLEFRQEDIPVLMRKSRDEMVRVQQIVQYLEDFSQIDSSQEWQWANLHTSIDSTLNIIASEIRGKVDVIKEYGTIPEIECQPLQLNQVIMSLLLNASYAIEPLHGQIIIRTGSEDEHIWIEVADTGSGISDEVLPHIFDPFFSTKPGGKGSGLGLSLSYGIVQKHRGHIEVQSEVGKGTTFRVTLPVWHEALNRPSVLSDTINE